MQPTATSTAASLREVKNVWRHLAAAGQLAELERQLARLAPDLAAVTRRADERTA